MLALEYKGINYESERIDPAVWDPQESGFYTLNPRGKVPVLEDDKTVIYESVAIMAYLEEKHPEVPLFGENPEQTGLIWQRIAELIHYTLEPVYELSRLIMRDTASNNIDHSKQLVIEIYKELTAIDSYLGVTTHIAGNSVTAADIYLYPAIAFLEKMLTRPVAEQLQVDFYPLPEKLTNLSRWMTRCEQMTGFEQAYPPHWRDEEEISKNVKA